jgi:hypothetical protein
MPSRIIREGWLESEGINALSADAERFFLRLCLRADDFGRYHANPTLLRSNLFPLKDDVRITDIPRWLAACERARLIRCYSADAKAYIEIRKFDQRTRAQVSKFPAPPPDDGLLPGICLTDVSHPRTYSYSYSDSETKSDSAIAPSAKPAGRERDILFDALAIAEGSDPKQLTASAAKKIAVALAEIKKVAPNLVPSDIQARARAYKRLYSGAALTAHALAAHWAKCGGSAEPAKAPPVREPAGWKTFLNHEYPDSRFSANQKDEAHEWSDLDRGTQQWLIGEMKKKGDL